MKTAVILHGMPSKEGYYDPEADAQSNCHWLPWLQRQLLLQDILAQTPELPHPYSPIYEDHQETFEQFNIDEQTILVGHSCGAGFLVRWLSENQDVSVDKVALVAPYLGDERLESDGPFFDFKFDSDLVERTKGVTVITANDDSDYILGSAQTIEDNIANVNWIKLPKGGHFTLSGMGTREFPELLEAVI